MPQRCVTHVATPENNVDPPRARSMRAAPPHACRRPARTHTPATTPWRLAVTPGDVPRCLPHRLASEARARKWTHWGLNPGPSACEADVIPLHHVPMIYLRKSAHTSQSIAGLVVEYIVLSLLLRCLCGFRACVVVAARLPLLPLAPLCHALFLAAPKPATLRAQALPGRLELPTLR